MHRSLFHHEGTKATKKSLFGTLNSETAMVAISPLQPEDDERMVEFVTGNHPFVSFVPSW